jgi:DNA repair exonuclease SbcCD ATPase subunit
MSSPLNFKEIQIRNFMSFGNVTTVVDLSSEGSTLILGENIDTNSNNGAGKTTIINAICYALYNKPFDSISLQRLLNTTNAAKNTLMEVRITFSKGDDVFEIYRCRGETFNIQVMMNGDDITLDSVTENDKLIQEIVGHSYDLFTKIIIFSGNSIPFLLMPVSQQRAMIEELFSITILTEKALKLKEVIKTTEGSIAIQEAIIKEQDAQVVLYNKQLKDAEQRVSRWSIDRDKQVKTLKDELALIATVNMDDEKELHTLDAALKTQESALSSKINIAKRDRTTVVQDVKKTADELKHLTVDKCPYCLQQYEGASEKLVEKQAQHVTQQQRLDYLDKLIETTTVEMDEITDQRWQADQLMKFSSLADAVRAESNALTAQEKIDDLITAENPHVEAFEQMKRQAVKRISYETLDVLKKDLEHQQFLLKLLIDKNSFIRRRIINKTIPFLNHRLVHYTKELGLPHIVKFDPDMSCTVSEYGRELDFGNLSSGEKKRVNLSLSLAFRDVLHHLHLKVNCLFIDEIDGSLDGAGVESVFKLLKQKSRDDHIGLWIISHRPEAIGRFDRSLIVRKENGFSRIVTEDEEMELVA